MRHVRSEPASSLTHRKPLGDAGNAEAIAPRYRILHACYPMFYLTLGARLLDTEITMTKSAEEYRALGEWTGVRLLLTECVTWMG